MSRKDWLTSLKPPITIEGRETDTDWQAIYTAATLEDFEFQLSSYQLPVYPVMRIRDADGHTFEVKQSDLLKYNADAIARTQAKIQPLQNFTHAAPADALKIALELIRGARVSQHFTIPPRAQVHLHHPALHHVVLMELEASVVCRIHVDDAEPDDSEPTVTLWKAHPDGHFSVTPEAIDAGIQAFLILLCAAIVRDFWVLEPHTRQRAYRTRTEKKRERKGTGKDRKLVVSKDYIFLPRFQYNLAAYQDRPRTIAQQTRVTLSPHLVSGHLRKLPDGWKRSDTAETTAKTFGITLGDGQTFVRPHERGEIEQLRTYRSRSAFKLIFGEGGDS